MNARLLVLSVFVVTCSQANQLLRSNRTGGAVSQVSNEQVTSGTNNEQVTRGTNNEQVTRGTNNEQVTRGTNNIQQPQTDDIHDRTRGLVVPTVSGINGSKPMSIRTGVVSNSGGFAHVLDEWINCTGYVGEFRTNLTDQQMKTFVEFLNFVRGASDALPEDSEYADFVEAFARIINTTLGASAARAASIFLLTMQNNEVARTLYDEALEIQQVQAHTQHGTWMLRKLDNESSTVFRSFANFMQSNLSREFHVNATLSEFVASFVAMLPADKQAPARLLLNTLSQQRLFINGFRFMRRHYGAPKPNGTIMRLLKNFMKHKPNITDTESLQSEITDFLEKKAATVKEYIRDNLDEMVKLFNNMQERERIGSCKRRSNKRCVEDPDENPAVYISWVDLSGPQPADAGRRRGND